MLLWQTQWGSVLLFPFTLLATWFHEMGHGLAAIMLGGEFDRLVIFADDRGMRELACRRILAQLAAHAFRRQG